MQAVLIFEKKSGAKGLITVSNEMKDCYKYVLPKLVANINGQSIYSVLQKNQRNIFQSSVPEHPSWHNL
jgi:hypothetical protein